MAGGIGLYVDESDIELLRERLNADPEIAFILPDGPGRWRAVWQVDDAQGQTMLWHVPAGPLPLLARGGGARHAHRRSLRGLDGTPRGPRQDRSVLRPGLALHAAAEALPAGLAGAAA